MAEYKGKLFEDFNFQIVGFDDNSIVLVQGDMIKIFSRQTSKCINVFNLSYGDKNKIIRMSLNFKILVIEKTDSKLKIVDLDGSILEEIQIPFSDGFDDAQVTQNNELAFVSTKPRIKINLLANKKF